MSNIKNSDDADLPFITAIIPAAGDSSRLAATKRKPWLLLNNEPIIFRTLRLIKKIRGVEEIILIVHPDDENYANDELGEKLEKAGVNLIITGGKNRAASVYNALQVTDPMGEIVAIHDAVRPFADLSMCNALCKMAHTFGAAIPVTPIIDSVKRVHTDKIIENVRRLGLMSAQTPQCFRRQLLIDAYTFAQNTGGIGNIGEHLTDDSALVENFGHEVRVILGNADNIKITTKDDLLLAEAMLKIQTLHV